jgi:hypothetical protein
MATTPKKPNFDIGNVVASAVPYGQAIYQGGKLLYNWLNPVKREQSSEEKAYRNILKNRATQGIYSPSQQNQMLNMVSAPTAQIASNAITKSEGKLQSQGISSSGVNTQTRGRIEAERMRTIAQQARRIAMENEQSKIDAQDKLGEIGFKDTDRDYKDALSRRTENISLMDAMAESAIPIAQRKFYFKKYGDDLKNWPLEILLNLSRTT